MQFRVALALKLCLLAIFAVIAIDGRHPPVHAQGRSQQSLVPVITAEDAVQDREFTEEERHFASTDARVQDLATKEDVDRNTLSAIQGEERGVAAVLGLLQLAGIVITVRAKKAA